MNNIVMTLGRTQPPHFGHIQMLINALFSLEDDGQLIHFVSSSNVPVSLAPGSMNILTTQQRIDLLTQGLKDEIVKRYEVLASAIPEKFAVRIQTYQPLLLPADFRCIPLPDFSDTGAVFNTAELQLARSGALKIVKESAFQAHVKAQGHTHADSYYAWAVNLKALLDDAVDAYCQTHPDVSFPKVSFFTATKDEETQQYVAVIMDIMNFLEPTTYDFNVNFMPVELIHGKTIHATAIREAILRGDQDAEALQSVPAGLLQKMREMFASFR